MNVNEHERLANITHSTNSWKGSALCIVWITSNKYFISPLVHLVRHFVLSVNYLKRVLNHWLGTHGMIYCIFCEFLQTSSHSRLMCLGIPAMTLCIVYELLQMSSEWMLRFTWYSILHVYELLQTSIEWMVRCTWLGILYCLNYFKRVLNECLGALGAAFCIVCELLQTSIEWMVRCTWFGILYYLNYFKRVLNECLGALGAAFCIVYELLQKSMNECVCAWVHLVWHVLSVNYFKKSFKTPNAG